MLENFKDITIIVPTFDRPEKCVNLINYLLREFDDIKIVIVQTFRKKKLNLTNELKNKKNIQLINLDPTVNLYKKLYIATEKITTPLSCVCADDDFVTIDGIKKSINFFKKHDDFVMCKGKNISFFKYYNNRKINFTFFDSSSSYTIDNNDPTLRVQQLLRDHTCLVYGTFRTNYLRQALEKTSIYLDASNSEIKINFYLKFMCFAELFFGLAITSLGKIKYYKDDIFYFRDVLYIKSYVDSLGILIHKKKQYFYLKNEFISHLSDIIFKINFSKTTHQNIYKLINNSFLKYLSDQSLSESNNSIANYFHLIFKKYLRTSIIGKNLILLKRFLFNKKFLKNKTCSNIYYSDLKENRSNLFEFLHN